MSLIFDAKNELIEGRIHSCSGDEFIKAFCKSAIDENEDDRSSYTDAIVNIFDYAREKGARRVFVGGSFVTTKKNPSDFDCVIVFNSASDIPNFVDTTVVGNIEFDILFASEDNPKIVDAFINLFQHYKNGLTGKPLVEVILANALNPWKVRFIPDDEEVEVINKIYTKRNIIERRKARGVLFSIHGVNTKAFWNSKLAPLACSQGWIFAPFIYESPVTLLVNPRQRRKSVEAFNDYFYNTIEKYGVKDASIIAHSFGTYIAAKFLTNHDYEEFLHAQIDSIVLTGAIVDKDFNWSRFFPNKVGRILNISSPNDRAVRFMPKWKWMKKYLMGEKDGIFGKIGVDGIITDYAPENFLTNLEIPILNHTNVFKNEILSGTIMPFLNAHYGAQRNLYIQHSITQRNGTVE